MLILDTQSGQCQLPNYLYNEQPPYYNSYESSMGIFYTVHNALMDVVVSLFKDATFKHRLDRRPKLELNGELLDRDGQTYGNVKKRSVIQDDELGPRKNRGLPVKRKTPQHIRDLPRNGQNMTKE
ncbi:hypothetical protein M434DRAFT_7713 [Hypoxylon sp. CO27-5]|nr:hypothetical protein M434DRAFT_7713 [Hypoxylon sp. CO27-5]